ncbi:MAG TPA: xanthine dehydrogenase family protein molybdopterin-binding subunit [Anaerolineaceae bacterium]
MAANPEIIIGGSNVRVDSLGKVTGKTRYVADMSMPGLLHAKVLRSPHHHACLLALNTTDAKGLPGVVRILTAADVPGLNGLDGYSRDEPLLTPVGDTLRQKGAPIALIIAETKAAANAACRAITVEYAPLPHTFDVADALHPDGVSIYPRGNLLNQYQVKWGNLDAELAASHFVLDTCYRTTFQEHSALEPDATLGYIAEDGKVTVIGGTHEPHWQQGFIAQTLGIDPAKVRVIVPATGGSFGNRQDPWPLVAVGLAAYQTQRPVRLAYTRREVFDATPKRHPYHVKFRIGGTADGCLTGIGVQIQANTGGYDSAGYWIPNYAVTSSGGPYVWRAVDATAQVVFTNGPKCGQFRGYGSPQSIFALECSLDEVCQKLDVDPVDFRVKNCLPQDATSFLGYPIRESLGYLQVLEAIRPHYREFQAEADRFNADPAHAYLRMGVGLAGMWYRFGKSGTLRIESHAELALDGHFVVYCSAPEYGQGITTVMVQLAAETLGVPRERIELINADTELTPDSGIQGGSRATYFVGSSIRNALQNLRDEIFGMAAELLDCLPESLVLDVDRVRSLRDPDQSVCLEDIAQQFERMGKPRRLIGIFDLTPEYPAETKPEYIPLFVTGAQLAQVIVDVETGRTQVTRMVAAHDVGRAINTVGAVGQIQGAIMMGIGTALREEYIPGVSTGFIDYVLPMVTDVPQIEVILVEVPSIHGPLGAKGLGEAAILPTAPAVINALSRAIGARIRQLPATPPRVLEAIAG